MIFREIPPRVDGSGEVVVGPAARADFCSIGRKFVLIWPIFRLK
ncbi:hypothetical protein ABZ436_01355 [Micromonospora matsumotoense]